jgi:hypothetical protein
LILRPDGLAARKVQETLSKEEIKLVIDFNRWALRRGLKMDLLCQKCVDEGLFPRCIGENDPDSTTFKIDCAHAERRYGNVNARF